MMNIMIHFDCENPKKTLCGELVNKTNLAFESWGSNPLEPVPGKTFEFCTKCEKLADEEMEALEKQLASK